MQQDLKSRPAAVALDDKWRVDDGRILLSGTQAIVRTLLAQKAVDVRNGLNTAGYISGYRGSPLGGVDTALWSIRKRLEDADILFHPGMNEDLAATAIRGTQQIEMMPGATRDGVFAAWYGKGPGVDRSGDALKHGNSAGAHAKGGVLAFYGDDHAGKSSTISHHSEQAIAAAMMPSLYPATVGEIIEYGLLGFALSRYSGCWVGIKCVNETVEQTATADIDLDTFAPVLPPAPPPPPEGINIRLGHHLNPLRNEQVVIDHRLPLVQKFVRANKIDRTVFRAAKGKLGIITAGKTYGDVQGALALLGLTEARAAELGVSLYKVGCIWPLEEEGLKAFAAGHDVLLVVEEKQAFMEPQAASILFNAPGRPLLLGKFDEAGEPLLSQVLQLTPAIIAPVIAERLARLGVVDKSVQAACASAVSRSIVMPANNADTPRRTPFYCSGCPHNTSTKVPQGSYAMSGIGCHAMVRYAYPEQSLTSTHMGAEGANWIGMSPFNSTKHIFQNMGDGTYYHSGSLAVRAAIAAGVNVTFKILYNDAVAMTGGQPVDGPISVAEIAQQMRHEGVEAVVLLSDDPSRHQGNPALPPNIRIGHRDELDAVQRDMREIPGVSVLIYEQTCAAEKRRRRKRNAFPNPPKRMFISKEVCEGCGDCSVQSTCVSVTPVETEFGRKRAIDQSNCNKDYSCLKGFCPSFITVENAEPRKPERAKLDASLFESLPPAPPAPISGDTFNVMVAGVGGTGVITVSAILGMAAHLDGLAVSQFDMTGLAQKNGAVYSHVRVGRSTGDLRSSRIGRGEADTLLAFDLVAALADEPAGTLSRDRTRAMINSDVSQTVSFQFDRNAVVSGGLLLSRIGRLLGEDAIYSVDAIGLAVALIGDSIASNMMLLGVAAQKGALPVSTEAIEQAVRLNGAAVNANLEAFRLGRLLAVQPDVVVDMRSKPVEPISQSLDEIVARRVERLTAYQDAAYASRYAALVERVRAAEQAVAPGSQAIAEAVARNYAKLLTYKDEYEVARLLTSPALHAEIAKTFADGAKLSFNLAPPILGGQAIDGRPAKRAFGAKFMLPALRVLARFKGLRGGSLDPFAKTPERRMERALIGEYEALVEQVLGSLSSANVTAAAGLLDMADEIRGYGPVKEAAVAKYRTQLADAQATFAQAPQARVAAVSG